ncbi:MAG: hypothetical protein ACFB50_00975 [Rubrobacteraceae bacterium]
MTKVTENERDSERENGVYRNGTQPVVGVSQDGSRLLPRRPSRELFPSSWLRLKSAITYTDGREVHELNCTPIATCGVGLICAANDGTKTLIGWDRLVRLELLES